MCIHSIFSLFSPLFWDASVGPQLVAVNSATTKQMGKVPTLSGCYAQHSLLRSSRSHHPGLASWKPWPPSPPSHSPQWAWSFGPAKPSDLDGVHSHRGGHGLSCWTYYRQCLACSFRLEAWNLLFFRPQKVLSCTSCRWSPLIPVWGLQPDPETVQIQPWSEPLP